MTARICATIHNELAELRWLQTALKLGKDAPPQPKSLDETHWLPRRIVKRKSTGSKPTSDSTAAAPTLTKAQAISRKITNAFSNMFGFGEK